MIRKALLAAMLAASVGSIALPALSAERGMRNGPPASREEAIPQPRRGHLWVPGHWDRNDRNRYVWVKGTWVRERRGMHYVNSQWAERDGRWHMQRGGWRRGNRDQDGDGIPNRADRDRDGDGVSNRRDDAPNNPNRR